MKKSNGFIATPMCCSDKSNVIESKIDPHSIVKSGSEQKRWNFYKRNKNRKKVLVDQAEQCDEDDIQKCLSDDVVTHVDKNKNFDYEEQVQPRDKIDGNERFASDLKQLLQNNNNKTIATIDPQYNLNQKQMPTTVNNFMIHMNGQQYTHVPYQTHFEQQPVVHQPSNNIFIVQTENHQTRITIVQSSDPVKFPSKMEDDVSEGDLSHDSLDDLVLGNFEYKENGVDVEPDSLMIGNNCTVENKEIERSPFKRRLNVPPIRQSRGVKNKIKTPSNPYEFFKREKENQPDTTYHQKWIESQQLTTSTLDRNSILHWSGDTNVPIKKNHNNNRSQWQQKNKIPEKSSDIGTLNRRNANTLKKLGVSCQNLSGSNTPERNFSAKSINRNFSKSEYDLSSRKMSNESTSGIKASTSRFEIMTKFFNFNKSNKIEPITASSVTMNPSSIELSKRVERVGWMKNISNYIAKKTRRSSNR